MRRALVDAGWTGPVVVAGSVDARDEVGRDPGGLPHVLADNVVPRIGVLAPDGARAAIREMFLAHVIGGKHLSASDDFRQMVRGATPDVVLAGVELLARGLDDDRPGAGDVAVVDVGGATTDVHSVVALDPEDAGLSREVVAVTPVTRTVEGDLGMRWSALVDGRGGRPAELAAVRRARRRGPARATCPTTTARPTSTSRSPGPRSTSRCGATPAASRVVVSPEGRVVERTGKDLREIDLLIGSGGVLRQRPAGGRRPGARRQPRPDHVEGGWQLPRAPRVVVDHDYALCAIGLLAGPAPRGGVPARPRLSGAE